MNLDAVLLGLDARLRTAVAQVYRTPPAQMEPPCAVISFVDVTSFHSDFAHEITALAVEIDVYVGRGEVDSAVVALSQYVSTDTPESVLAALENKDPALPTAWRRLHVASASNFRTEGDAFGVTFFLEINA